MSEESTASPETNDRLIDWTGERCVPWTDDFQVIYEHYHRYALAASLAKGKRVVDLACGEGYGANMIAQQANSVLGVDIDEATIRHAQEKYVHPGLTFGVGSMLESETFANLQFDLVVCFEALEHVDDHDTLLSVIKQILAPDGLLVISTPDTDVYSGELQQDNPFHTHELTYSEFQELLSARFQHVSISKQVTVVGSWIQHELQQTTPTQASELRPVGDDWAVDGPSNASWPYLIAYASDQRLPRMYDSILIDPEMHIVRAPMRRLYELEAKNDELSQANAELKTDLLAIQQSEVYRATLPIRWAITKIREASRGRTWPARGWDRKQVRSGPRRKRLDSENDYAGVILVVDEQIPEHNKNAGALTLNQYLNLLNDEGFRVILWPDDRAFRPLYTEALEGLGIEVVLDRISFRDWLNTQAPEIDFAYLARPDLALTYIEALRNMTKARILYYTHDLHFLREQRRYEVDRKAAILRRSRDLKTKEVQIFSKVDCVCTPSAEEGEIIRHLAPSVDIVLLPPYFFSEPGVESRNPHTKTITSSNVLFVGGYLHTPNVDAAKTLINDVMPLVWKEMPDVRVTLAGSHPTEEIFALSSSRVVVPGFVPNLGPYYVGARMTVNPLRFGAGVKGKIVESLREGVPVVTTPIGVEGIGVIPGRDALVGTDSNELAEHVLRLLRDPTLCDSLAASGRRLVARNFGFSKAHEAFMRALRSWVCSICGGRIPASVAASAVSNSAITVNALTCTRCRADYRTEALARVIIAPFRSHEISCLRSALPELEKLRIHEYEFIPPIFREMAKSRKFSASTVLGQAEASEDSSAYVQTMDLHDETCDLTFSQDLLEKIYDDQDALKDILRTLKVGGRHVFTTTATIPDESNDHDGLSSDSSVKETDDLEASRVRLSAEIANSLISAGFRVTEHEILRAGAPQGGTVVFEALKLKRGSSSGHK